MMKPLEVFQEVALGFLKVESSYGAPCPIKSKFSYRELLRVFCRVQQICIRKRCVIMKDV